MQQKISIAPNPVVVRFWSDISCLYSEITIEPYVKLLPAKAGADSQRIYYCFDHELELIIPCRRGFSATLLQAKKYDSV
jgi:hypothetical protein